MVHHADPAFNPHRSTTVRLRNQGCVIRHAPEQGLDGLHPIFFQKTWDILGEDICNIIRDWFIKGGVAKEIYQEVICLIPKEHLPETVKHLHPISLRNTLCKVWSIGSSPS